jgi:hypothetical protein
MFLLNIFYRRYSDDLVFVCTPDEKDAVLKFVDESIRKSILKINAKKSFISYFKKADEDIACEKVTDGLNKQSGRDYLDYLGLELSGRKIFLRKNTIQKLRHKQIEKTEAQLLNSVKQKRRKPKKIRSSVIKNRSNYLKRAAEIIDNSGIKNQVLKVNKDRNKIKSREVT